MRPRRRGRTRARGSPALLARFLDHVIGSSQARARHTQRHPRTLQRQLTRSRDLFIRTTSWAQLPRQGPLILVADAMIQRLRGRWYTTYVLLIRTATQSRATIAPPILLPGKEGQPEWRAAIATLPPAIQRRIRALVCDGHLGLVNEAKRRGWVIQRCHFHLLAAIQGRRSRWHASRHWREGAALYAAVKAVLDAPADAVLDPLVRAVDDYALDTRSPQLQKILRGFITHVEDFRNYRYHPELCLPRTSNTAESFIGCITALLGRLRGVSNVVALYCWIEALAKYKRTIQCNGFHQPNNCR